MVDSLGTPYDYSSMMHYGSTAFGIGGRMTIQTKDPSKQNLIGNRKGFSQIDIQQLKLMYKCGGGRPATARPKPRPQGCANKAKFCVKWAQMGYCRQSKWKSYMKTNCCKSYNTGGGSGGSGSGGRCNDLHRDCRYQASRGYCSSSRYG